MTTRTRLVEASALDRVRYRQRLRDILDEIDSLNAGIDRETIELFSELRQSVVARIADLGDSPSAAAYQRAIAGIDETIGAWAERFGLRVDVLQQHGFDLGEDLVVGPLTDAGATLEVADLGVTTDQARILTQFRADLIGSVTDDLRKRVHLEVAGIATGASSVNDAVGRIGRNLTDRNHFSTIAHRARAIVVTEVGRAQALATQASQESAARQIEGLRKRWINAHLPGARETHLAVEAATAPGGDPGPIPVDAEFTVAGFQALYPRDPSLPASESVNCHCVTITVIADTELAEPGAPVTDNDEQRADAALDDDPDDEAGRGMPAYIAENRKRMERLASPLSPPAGFAKWANTRKLDWLEKQMEADWPLAGPPSQVVRRVKNPAARTAGQREKLRRSLGRPLNQDDLYIEETFDPSQPVFDLKGTKADTVLPTLNKLRELAVTSNPQIARDLRYVGAYRGDKALPFRTRKANAFGGEVAHASVDGIRMGLNPKYYNGTLDDLGALSARCFEQGWWTTDHPLHVVVHEWGHLADRATRLEFPDSHARLMSAREAPSKYGRSSPSESFAEAYAAAQLAGEVTGAPAAGRGWIDLVRQLAIDRIEIPQ